MLTRKSVTGNYIPFRMLIQNSSEYNLNANIEENFLK